MFEIDRRAIAGLAIVGSMGWLKKIFSGATASAQAVNESPMAVIVLLRRPLAIGREALNESLAQAFPGHFGPVAGDGSDSSFVIDDESSSGSRFFIKCLVEGRRGMFLFHDVDGPYFDFSNIQNPNPSHPLHDLSKDHAAWMSVDLVREIGTRAEGALFIRNLIARLAPTDAVAVLDLGSGKALPYSEAVRSGFQQGADVFQ